MRGYSDMFYKEHFGGTEYRHAIETEAQVLADIDYFGEGYKRCVLCGEFIENMKDNSYNPFPVRPWASNRATVGRCCPDCHRIVSNITGYFFDEDITPEEFAAMHLLFCRMSIDELRELFDDNRKNSKRRRIFFEKVNLIATMLEETKCEEVFSNLLKGK